MHGSGHSYHTKHVFSRARRDINTRTFDKFVERCWAEPEWQK
jgi:hypothetical protein